MFYTIEYLIRLTIFNYNWNSLLSNHQLNQELN